MLTTGPLTSPALTEDLQQFTGMEYLSFFDAASPIVVGDSINKEVAFLLPVMTKGRRPISTAPLTESNISIFGRHCVRPNKLP
ncbi:FAD-dependent oxidoreductase [Synechocystis sp. B12]|nr:FAD-dependent oxidoreductase [Synechocystis sp. B12]